MSSTFDQVIVGGDVEALEESELSLLEILDHVLARGLVIAGEITISVADVDLIFMGLNVVLTSVETAPQGIGERVVSRVLAKTATLPFRFGTLVSVERLDSFVAPQEEVLRAQLERVRGCVEM